MNQYISCATLLLLALSMSPCVAGEQPNLVQGLIHYWSFDRADDTGTHPPKRFPDGDGDIPLFGSRNSGEWLMDGVAGKAVDVSNNVYLDGTERDLSPAQFTVAGWIRYEAATRVHKTRSILSSGNHSSPLEKPWVFQLSERKLSFVGGSKSVKTTDVVPEGRWVHVAAVVSAAEAPADDAARAVRLYVDGCEAATGTVGITPAVAQVLVGNTHRGGPCYFCGQIDELAVWDRALSAEEIAALQRFGSEGQALSSLVAARPTVSIKAEKDPADGSGGAFVLERDSDRGALRVHVTCSGLGIPGTDYAPLATIQTFADGARELRIPVARLEGSPVISRDDVKATLEPGIFYTVREAAAAARVWLTPDWPVPPPARPRKIYAHYMACYPVAAAATAYHRANDAHKIRHDGQGQFDAIGDRWRNWPLVPDGINLSLEESADLDIRRALRAGIDGFAIDAWAGGDNAKQFFGVLLKVARDKDYPFEVTVCLDPGVLGNGGMRDTLRWIMQEHGQNPKLARRDGKPLIFGYLSSFIGFHHGAEALKQEPEFADTDHKELIKNRDLRKTKAGWQRMADGHREIEKAAGTPLFIHYCMSAFFQSVGGTPAEILQAATFMAGQFGAVGEFTGGGRHHDEMAKAVRAAGAEWSEPMYFQYENIGWGDNRISQGTSILRDRWQHARDNESTLIQFVTWNDYTENTCLAPAYETRYAILDLNAYFIQWWKNGQPPVPDHDKVYLLYRKYPKGATIFPFKPRQPDAGGVLEVLTILTKPARLRLPGRHEEWEAPVGLSWKQFPLTPGPVVAELLRRNWLGVPRVELRLESPEPITDRPYREQNSLTCVSSECLRQWKLDFGDAPPVWRGEYADDDRDGLPNWFEMYWYGKFLDYRTCTNAAPETGGTGGKTLLQHYLDQTDPTQNTERAK